MGFPSANPKVTIIIPVYNGGSFLREAIRSALDQTYSNLEIIVVNDGSCDHGETERIALSFGEKIRYRYQENGGVSAALNLAIEMATGEYVCWLSHDDLYLPTKVEREVAYAQTLEPTQIVFCGYFTMNKAGGILKQFHLPPNVAAHPRCLLAMDTVYSLNGCTMLFPRSVFTQDMRFDTRRRYSQDYDLWFRLLERNRFVYLDECLFLSRQHEEQGSKSSPRDAVYEEADTVHAQVFPTLQLEEVWAYLDGDLDRLSGFETIFSSAGFPATTANLVRLHERLLMRYRGQNEALRYLCGALGIRSEVAPTLLEPDAFGRRTLVVYAEERLCGETRRAVSQLLTCWQAKYRVIYLSRDAMDEGRDSLSEGAVRLSLGETLGPSLHPQAESVLSFQLTCLCHALQGDGFIGLPNTDPALLRAYPFLKRIGVRTVLYNLYPYFLPYQLERLKPLLALRKHAFASADIVLWPLEAYARLGENACDHVAFMPCPGTLGASADQRSFQEKTILLLVRTEDSPQTVEQAMSVWEWVRRQEPQAELMLVALRGDGIANPRPEQRIPPEAPKDAKASENAVRYALEVDDVEPFFRKASVCLAASAFEMSPAVGSEAAAMGVPMVAYGAPCFGDPFPDDGHEGCFSLEQKEDAAQYLVSLLRNPSDREKLGIEAQRRVKRHTTETIGLRWNTLLDLLWDQEAHPLRQSLREAGLQTRSEIPLTMLSDMEAMLERMALAQTSAEACDGFPVPNGAQRLQNRALFKQYSDLYGVHTDREQKHARKTGGSFGRMAKPFQMMSKGLAYCRQEGILPTLRKVWGKLRK